ncbi:hypothetical protein BOTBODRAFT_113538 [Botryobasidium botryosum FD-172 SS1]|uniref:Pseudouridine synthase n=1 Tax=Botryobasidium botryosum (strain FD-172 SS1) TaxID=930990 RepID=A0A067M8U5_BOTB1|nr:hypothetical protein BOTBODRAFT_113538 [Botryobasidium botryosum FD-172 SS1]
MSLEESKTPPNVDGVAIASPGLKKIPAYWHPYRTYAKERWWNREILELVSTEFRDRSIEYYRYALESGVTTINGKVALPGTIVRNGDRLENMVHRHEPPVTSNPVKILHVDEVNEFIVIDKPGSIPVHATGRYFKNSLVEILKTDFGFPKIHTVNRLDRLTSGCMIIALSSHRAKLLCAEFINGTVKKEYIARCSGRFPEGEVVVDEPMICVDRQMGLNIVHPEGKHAKTIFTRLFYDEQTDTSVLHCRPLTGRSHQIRVHLQYIGYPIANDPVYSNERAWGAKRGKGGLSIIPSSLRSPPVAPPMFPQATQSRPKTVSAVTQSSSIVDQSPDPSARILLPRETGEDIGISSPVPLSAEAVDVITKLRNMKDADEDWSRWRDVIFRAKAALTPGVVNKPAAHAPASAPEEAPELQGTDESSSSTSNSLYCPECYLPLHPDPKPEKLYIFLHALRYTTLEWSFETEMPFWAKEGWVWNRETED